MEGHDVFGGGVEIDNGDDPFQNTDFGDFEPEQPAGELKTVDKEGNEVTPQDGASAESQAGEAAQPSGEVQTAPEAAPAPAESASEAKPDPTPPSTESSPEATVAASDEPGAPASAPTESATASEGASTPASTATTAGATAEQIEGDQGDPTPASSEQPPTEPTPGASSSGSEDVEDAPVPEEPTDKSGRRLQRRYVILRVDGPGKFTQVDWYVDSEGNMSATRKPGHRRQTVALARGTDDALKIGFVAAGAPQDGATLVAVAALHFQPKKIRPMPPEPTKQRLQIS